MSKLEVLNLRISQIEPDRNQPRKYFNDMDLLDLSVSILENGVIEPIIVKPMENGFYKIIAGERRWRASRMANLTEIPVIVKENITDLDAFKLAFNENLQRKSLTPIEEALGYVRLRDEFNLTQEEIAKSTGKSRSTIANSIRLLKLPQSVQDMVSNGSISVAHAKYILSVDEQYQEQLANAVVDKGISTSQLKFEVKRLQSKPRLVRPKRCEKYFKEVEISLINTINRPVTIVGTEKKGTITLEFYGKEDLNFLANVLEKLLDEQKS